MKKTDKKKIGLDALFLVMSIVIVTGFFVFWSNYKVMWFCDEIYSYFTANSGSSIGPRIEYGKWYDSQFVIDDMTTECGRYFGRTLHNVETDDHPPIYFLTMHMASLIMRGSISKWVGLSINLVCLIGICTIAYLLFYYITGNRVTAMLSAVTVCIVPSTLTNSMLIRMYCMQTAWAMLFVYLSYLIMQENIKNHVKYILYVVLSFVTAFGFLTQYYFAVFAAGFTLCYGISCIIRKRWKELGCYAASMVLSVGIATKLWGHWTEQLFEQYCGEEVMSKAADFSGIFKELLFGLTVMPKLTFYKLYIAGIVLVIAGVAILIYKKDRNLRIILFLLLSSLFYSLIVAHVTPSYYLDYRYFYLPTQVAYVAVVLIFISCVGHAGSAFSGNILKYGRYAVLLFLIVFNMATAWFDDMAMGYVDKTGEYNQKREVLKEYSELPWVYYGFEDWSMMENYYDFALGSRFICYNDMFDFDSKVCPAGGEDFIFLINKNLYKNQEDILEKLNQTDGCKHEVEFMFSKGCMFYLVRHR